MKKNVVMLAVLLVAVQVFACAAITKKGTLCKRAPVPGSQYCWQQEGRCQPQEDIEQADPSPAPGTGSESAYA